MGSSSSSYGPKAIYLDVDGKVQKVFKTFYWFLGACLHFYLPVTFV